MAKTANVRVVMTASISGTREGADWPKRGEVLVCGPLEAADLIHAGYAKPEKDAPVVERAVAPKGETRKGGLTKASTGL